MTYDSNKKCPSLTQYMKRKQELANERNTAIENIGLFEPLDDAINPFSGCLHTVPDHRIIEICKLKSSQKLTKIAATMEEYGCNDTGKKGKKRSYGFTTSSSSESGESETCDTDAPTKRRRSERLQTVPETGAGNEESLSMVQEAEERDGDESGVESIHDQEQDQEQDQEDTNRDGSKPMNDNSDDRPTPIEEIKDLPNETIPLSASASEADTIILSDNEVQKYNLPPPLDKHVPDHERYIANPGKWNTLYICLTLFSFALILIRWQP